MRAGGDWDRLAAWYSAGARDLPWRRRSDDPYAILVSEFMLQQTRVETVVRHYEPFLDRYPTVDALAAAALEEVLGAWSGLGYYRRARHLHRAAVEIATRHGGRVPDDPDALRALPGIGDYTAGAILSIAYGQRQPILDGNVIRVLSRHEAVGGDPRRAAVRRTLRQAAADLLEGRDPAVLNQALMELGARLCLPDRPACDGCPIGRGCRALAAGQVERYPETTRPKATIDIDRAIAIVRRGRKLLLARNQGTPRLDGFLVFPGVDLAADEDGPTRLERHLAEEHRIAAEIGPPIGRVRHAITHHRYRCQAFEARPLGPVRTAGTRLAWRTLDQLAGEAIPAQTRKVLDLIAAG